MAKGTVFGIGAVDKTDHRHRWLLRARRERPRRCRAAKTGYKFSRCDVDYHLTSPMVDHGQCNNNITPQHPRSVTASGEAMRRRDFITAVVVAASALRVAGSFGKCPDTASMQRLRASLSDDT
jgi:hypothetical protein